MPDRAAKNFCSVVVICPHAHLRLAVGVSICLSKWRCRVKNLHRVIKLTLWSDESRPESFHNRMAGVEVVGLVRIVSSVAWRLHSDEFKPSVVVDSVTMHGTVNQNRRQSVFVRLQNAVDKFEVLDV